MPGLVFETLVRPVRPAKRAASATPLDASDDHVAAVRLRSSVAPCETVASETSTRSRLGTSPAQVISATRAGGAAGDHIDPAIDAVPCRSPERFIVCGSRDDQELSGAGECPLNMAGMFW